MYDFVNFSSFCKTHRSCGICSKKSQWKCTWCYHFCDSWNNN